MLLLSNQPWLKLKIPPFFSSSNSIQRRRQFHVYNLYGLTSSRKQQVQDFLQAVTTKPSLEQLQRNGVIQFQTIAEFNRLLESLILSDEFETALKLKSSLSSLGLLPDTSTYSIMVNGFCKNKEAVEARSVLHEMLENGFEPNVAIFTAVINSFCEKGRLRDAYEVLDVMFKIRCQPTVNTYNCLMQGLCYVGRVEEASDLLDSMKKRLSIQPDIYTYTALMDGFCKVGRSNEALELLDEALEIGLTPSVVTYNTLFNGSFKEGKPLRGFALLKRMEERNCRPDYITYSTFLHGLLKWGKSRAAFAVYNDMVGNGYRVDERMMNTLLRVLSRHSRKEKEVVGDAYKVFEEMRDGGYAVYQDAFELVVEALCNGGEIQRGFDVFKEMIGIGFSPKTFTFNIVVHALCSSGEVEKALEALMLMHKDRKARGIPFNALIGELNRRGRLLEACGVYGFALKKGVVPKRKPRYTFHSSLM